MTSMPEREPAEPEQREVVVVGGGIAGLAAAWQLRDRDVLVLETDERTGGRIRSEARGRYWLNFGAHVFGGAGSATGTLIDETRVEAATVPGVLTAFMRVGLRLRIAVARYGRIIRPRPGESEAERRARTLGFLAPSPTSSGRFHRRSTRSSARRSSAEPEDVAAGYGVGYFHLV